MRIIEITNLSKSFNDNLVLDNISLSINSSDKIGIIGKNGCGKSTLIKIICGDIDDYEGSVIVSDDRIGYLKQITEYTNEDFLNMCTSKEGLSKFLKLNSEFGITKDIDYSAERLKNLSGGEKTKIALSYILSKDPSILIMDEPTNHVDIKSIDYLINIIKNYSGTLIVVSHDRYFLNQTVNKIIEIDRGKINIYNGNYDYYALEKEKELAKMKSRYENEQKLDKKIKNEIRKLNEWSNKGEREAGRQGGMRSDSKIKGVKTNAQRKAAKLSSSAENKKKRLEKLREDFIDKPYESKDIKYFFNGEDLRVNALVKLTDVSKEYDGKLIFENVNFEIKSNDKIGLIGPNGCGKSTLIKIINGEIESSTGSIWKTPSLKMAYMSQDVFDIDDSLTINEFASRFDANKKQFFFSNLVNMGVDRSIFKNKISSLSLGQRMKIKLVQIILEEYNLLVLDEPTNHLDLENKIELENALITFPGSILIATHDRYLLKNLTNSLIVFENKEVKKIDKGYSEYFDDKKTIEKDNDISDRKKCLEEMMARSDISEDEMEKLLQEYSALF